MVMSFHATKSRWIDPIEPSKKMNIKAHVSQQGVTAFSLRLNAGTFADADPMADLFG